MKFIIPTYKRSETITRKTLRVLREGLVKSKDIWLFLASKEEEVEYRKNVDASMFGHIVVGELGVVNQRNFITHYFEEDDCLVEVDDDLETLEELDASGTKLVYLNNIPKFCEEAFERCKAEKCGLWGVYPVHNAYFMRPTVSTDLKFCVGCFNGRFNRKSVVLSIEEKDDFERTMKYYLEDNKVIRFNSVCFKTKYYNKVGGKGEEKLDRKAESVVAAKKLVELFPKLCRLYVKKKSGYAEVRLKDRRVIGGEEVILPETNIFVKSWEEDCKVMEKIISKIEYLHSRPKMAYCSKGNGTALYGDTWKSHAGAHFVRQPHPTKKGRWITELKRKNPHLMPIFVEFGKKYFPEFKFTQIQMNKNWYCPPHFDAKNTGESVLVAFGKYKGGDTCYYDENAERSHERIKRFDARKKPLKMDGSKVLHWVEPTRKHGDRYSLVFFNMKLSN